MVREEEFVVDGETHTRVALCSQTGEKLYVDNLLPEGVQFRPGITGQGEETERYFQYGNPERGHKEHVVYYGDIDTPEGVYALFHEVGHAWNDAAGLPSGPDGMTVRATFGRLADKIFKTHFERNDAEAQMLEERDASAHALRALRALRDAGYPLQEATSARVGDYIQECLKTYQDSDEEFGNTERLKPRRSFVSGRRKQL
ncbi:MAG: hypothetical protein IPJ68_00360 [Candidatus Moraniibacteriota bacterium]|nr:MAG: hypothetical protein IPJ68_00360 [Candidatus Moranbacteria bacterium]